MTIPPPYRPPQERLGRLYTWGLPIVVLVDSVLSYLVASFRAQHAATRDSVETAAYTCGYASCSLIFCFGLALVVAMVMARVTGKPLRHTLIKVAFWAGVTWVPLFLLFRAVSIFRRFG